MATDREITESEVRHLLAERIGDRGIATLRNNAAAIAQELARLSEENRKLREMFDLATSIHTMTNEQLQQLIANCKAAKEMK